MFSISRLKKIPSLIYLDRAKPEDTVVCVSSGRSGSTWLSRVITDDQTRVIFEPFHGSRGIPGLRDYRFKHIPCGTVDDSFEQRLDALMAGQCRSVWMDSHNPKSTFVFNRRFIKVIRANLMLEYLASSYPDVKFVLLLRHPAAVALSQVRGGWDLDPSRLRSSFPSFNEIFDRIEWHTEGFRSNLLWWMIENKVALQATRFSNVHLVLYEHLVLDLDRTTKCLGEKFDLDLSEDRIITADQPSVVTVDRVNFRSGPDMLNAWTKKITEADREYLEHLLVMFKLGGLYSSKTGIPIVSMPFEMLN